MTARDGGGGAGEQSPPSPGPAAGELTTTFSQAGLDRASLKRGDAEWLQSRLHDAGTRILQMKGGDPLVHADVEGAPRLCWRPAPCASRLLADPDRWLFLGLEDEAARFAVDVREGQGEEGGEGARFAPLREFASMGSPAESAVAGVARAVFGWRARTRFCANCGGLTQVAQAGWRLDCPQCGAEHFPRVDPVAIMLPVRGDRCLLARQAAWPPGRMSALAGFIEPGESAAEACVREVREESGLEVTGVRLLATQPWPFPHSLMIGFVAEVADGEAAPADGELEAVRWVSREEIARLLAGERVEGVELPPPMAIARQLIAAWSAGG